MSQLSGAHWKCCHADPATSAPHSPSPSWARPINGAIGGAGHCRPSHRPEMLHWLPTTEPCGTPKYNHRLWSPPPDNSLTEGCSFTPAGVRQGGYLRGAQVLAGSRPKERLCPCKSWCTHTAQTDIPHPHIKTIANATCLRSVAFSTRTWKMLDFVFGRINSYRQIHVIYLLMHSSVPSLALMTINSLTPGKCDNIFFKLLLRINILSTSREIGLRTQNTLWRQVNIGTRTWVHVDPNLLTHCDSVIPNGSMICCHLVSLSPNELNDRGGQSKKMTDTKERIEI